MDMNTPTKVVIAAQQTEQLLEAFRASPLPAPATGTLGSYRDALPPIEGRNLDGALRAHIRALKQGDPARHADAAELQRSTQEALKGALQQSAGLFAEASAADTMVRALEGIFHARIGVTRIKDTPREAAR